MTTRRDFMALLGAIAVPATLRAAAPGLSAKTYAGMTVIDGECFFREGGKDIGNQIPLSESFAAAVRASGLTAISTTVGGCNVSQRRLRTMEETRAFAGAIDTVIASRPDLLLKIQRAADLTEAKRSGRMGILFNTQGTDELDGDPARITELTKLGVRMFQLTYNNGALTGDGCMEPRNAGLTVFGRDVIAAIESEHCLLDLSHVGQRTTAEAIAAARQPCLISHAGCNAISRNPRNVDDTEIKAIAKKGGVFGIFFMPMLRQSGQCQREDVIAHLEHAVQVAGEDHVSLGTDGEVGPLVVDEAYREAQRKITAARVSAGVDKEQGGEPAYRYVPGYNVPNRFQLLGDDLLERGHSRARVEKILGGNLARLYREVLAS